MKRIFRRFNEMLLCSVLLSAILMLFDSAGVFPRNQLSYTAVLAVASVFYVGYIIKRLRRYYKRTKKRRNYYIKSYIAYGIFAVLSLAIYLIFGQTVFAWLFCVTMPFYYILYGVPLFAAILIYHAFMLVVILLAPHRIRFRELLYTIVDNYDEEYE